jgi:integrase/recombinase XerD
VAWALRALRHRLLVTVSPVLASSHIAHRVALPDGREAWTVLDVNGAEVGSVSVFLRYLHRIERSPNTVRAYAYDLKLFCEFLAGRGLAWDAVGVADLGDFAAWLRAPAPNVLLLPGARPARSSSTTNRALTAVMGF